MKTPSVGPPHRCAARWLTRREYNFPKIKRRIMELSCVSRYVTGKRRELVSMNESLF